MFQPQTVKAFSIVAMVFAGIGLLTAIAGAFLFSAAIGLMYFLSIVSWGLLLWAAWIGFRLCSYKLYEEEYKKVGIRIYLILPISILFVFVLGFFQLIMALSILGALWALKSNYDDWDSNQMPPPGVEDTPPNA